eukprot:284819873_6
MRKVFLARSSGLAHSGTWGHPDRRRSRLPLEVQVHIGMQWSLCKPHHILSREEPLSSEVHQGVGAASNRILLLQLPTPLSLLLEQTNKSKSWLFKKSALRLERLHDQTTTLVLKRCNFMHSERFFMDSKTVTGFQLSHSCQLSGQLSRNVNVCGVTEVNAGGRRRKIKNSLLSLLQRRVVKVALVLCLDVPSKIHALGNSEHHEAMVEGFILWRTLRLYSNLFSGALFRDYIAIYSLAHSLEIIQLGAAARKFRTRTDT